jgi:hypothetical protein
MKVELSRFIILGMFTAFHRLDSRDDASLGLPGRMTTGMVGAMFGILPTSPQSANGLLGRIIRPTSR